MNVLTIWIILGVVHILLTTLFIVKGEDWFDIDDYVIYIIAPTVSIGLICSAIFIFVILAETPMTVVWTGVVVGLPIGLAWLIKKVRK
jgi:hypothetical protein